ncbi:MAG TPA: fibronectin type III domain-containing protein [Jiangellaceae bacterium]|nr:fibronectin type III domain-containing protein [Jiangellaceae bacterium]
MSGIRRLSRPLRALLTTLLILVGVVAVAPAARAAEAPVILGASSWYGGKGVAVCGKSTAEYCGGEFHVGGVSDNWWQCVELAQRFYKKQGWHTGVFAGVDYAFQIYDNAASLGMTRQVNGSITSIVPGDMIVHAGSQPDTYGAGHVVVVETISSGKVGVVEQNSSPDGRDTYTLSGQTLSHPSGHILGVVHDPDNVTVRPAQPTNPVVTSTTGTTAVLAWTDASSNETGFRTQYRIGTGAWVAGPTVAANATSVTVGGLRAGTTYTFQVGARNSVGTRWSVFFYGTTGTPPAQPTSPRVTSTTSSSAVLAWTDASSNESDFVTHYRIGTGAWVAGPSVGANATSVTVGGLSAGTAYTFQVGARNSAGTRWSVYTYGTTSAATALPAQPTSPRVTSTTSSSAVLAWTDASSNESDFVTHYRIGTGAWVAGPSVGANATSVTVGGLSAGTAYTFQVGARNSAGTRWSVYFYGSTGAALAASPGDIIRHPDGDAYVLSGTTSALVRHWIPTPADFTCARAEADRRVVAVTRSQVDGITKGADRPGGNCLIRGPGGDVHFVNNSGRREWVPDSPTFDCEAGRGVRLLGVSAEFIGGVGADGWHYCLNQANLHGKVLRHSDGDASYIHPDNSRTWIPDGPTFQCRLNQGKVVVETRWREYVTSFRDAGWDYCYDVNALKNRIISHPDGDSHFVDGRGVRHWIKDAATYNCLRARGIAADTVRWRDYVNRTPEGEWAVCGDTLAAGQKLDRGQWLMSSDGRYTLHMQTDGNLVAYNSAHRAIWATDRLGTFAIVQWDGNFVEYGSGALWATNTAGSGANRLVMQSDGNLVLYAGSRVVWASNTVGR